MTEVHVHIEPPIPLITPEPENDTEYLDEYQFANVINTYEISYIFGQHSASYGYCNLFYYYGDICEEIHKIHIMTSHYIEMSGYTVAKYETLGETSANIVVYGADDTGNFVENRVEIDSSQFLERLRIAKSSIEQFVKATARVSGPLRN